MKKTLLIAAGIIAAAALQANALNPQVISDVPIGKTSPNGNWIAGTDAFGSLIIIDLANDKKTVYTDEFSGEGFSAGNGKCITDNGIFVGGTPEFPDMPAILKDGKWTLLPVPENSVGISAANAITNDAKRIAGYVGATEMSVDADNTMVIPAVWDLNAAGEYEVTILPYPKTDFSGRVPQYILVDDISQDGKTIGGQVMDYSGSFPQPIIFKQDENGEWSYTLLLAEIFNNPALVWPEDPGDNPEYPEAEEFMSPESIAALKAAMEDYEAYTATEPKVENYMTEDELDAYLQALAEYDYESGDPYPQIEDFMTDEEKEAYDTALTDYYANLPEYPEPIEFMTEEEKEAYEAALEDYNTANEEWWAKWSEFEDTFDSNTMDFPTFSMNNVFVSGNGKYYATTDSEANFFNPDGANIPYLFDLEEGSYITYADDSVFLSFVNDNGALIGNTGVGSMNGVANAFISPKAGEKFMPITKYVRERNSETFTWMESNMKHTYYSVEYDMETWEEIYIEHKNEWITGLAIANDNLSTLFSWNANVWDMDDEAMYFSYVLPIGDYQGLASAATEGVSVKGLNGGRIAISANVAKLEVFDINGRLVLSVAPETTTIATGLQRGIYVIKATTADGATAVAKAAL